MAARRDAQGRFIKGSSGAPRPSGSGSSKPIVQDIDHGYARIMRDMQRLKGASTRIGIQAGEKRDDGVDMVDIAAFNEFGTERIPARPAHAQAFDANRQVMEQSITRAFDGILAGRLTVEKAMGLLGEKYQAIVRDHIEAFTDPPNAESTQERKGAKVGPGVMVDNPLIDTGQMVQSVRHVEEYT